MMGRLRFMAVFVSVAEEADSGPELLPGPRTYEHKALPRGIVLLFCLSAQPTSGSSASRLPVHVRKDKSRCTSYAAFDTGLVHVNRLNASSTGVSTMWLV